VAFRRFGSTFLWCPLTMPNRPFRLLLAVLACVVAAGCQPSPGDALIEQTAVQMQDALHLLEQAHGDDRALLEGAMTWRARHPRDPAGLRERGEAWLKTLDAPAREKWTTAAHNRWEPLVAQLELAAQKYPKPTEALRYVRPLWGQTPQGIHGTPWLAEVPPLPPELLAPPPSPTAPP
jgi:hypothetical protein